MITEGLERPLFTSGMVLSDTDLTALVDWIRARFALGRHRHGWGVAAGLDVRCRPDRPSQVVVETGYAVSSTGADLVVAAAIDVDLAEFAGPPRAQGTKPDPCGEAVVDLFLEELETPAVAELVDRCGCGGGCDRAGTQVLTRLREGARVIVKPVPQAVVNDDPEAGGVAKWQTEWTSCHQFLRDFLSDKQDAATGDEIISWLDRRTGLEPPCDWLPTLRAALKGLAVEPAKAVVTAAFLDLVAVHRHRLLRRQFTEPGLRLARVWLRQPAATATPAVARVDVYPPYRRELSLSPGHPVAGGTFDLTSLVWHRWDQAVEKWHAFAGAANAVVVTPGTVPDLLTLLDDSDLVAWSWFSAPPLPILVDTTCLGRRVLGFRSLAKGLEPVSPGPGIANAPVPVPVPVPEPAPAPGPTPEPDPLEEISGIGRTTIGGLRAAGINTFQDLVDTPTAVLTKLLRGQRIDKIKAAARERIGPTP
ncbi:helix-hairpin-helix domain-containing protein [Actinoplanes sp. CA-015351]|uniref:helix-hairpin-helix domain-containing protein n=1 Tax=Actinoplanes sp. CA-015351 TaxID=3239897 RepID=UPI003D972DA0